MIFWDIYDIAFSVRLRVLWPSWNLPCIESYQDCSKDWPVSRCLRTARPFDRSVTIRTIRWCITHWGRDKIDAISQTIFVNAFSWMKNFEFQYFIDICSLGSNWQYIIIGSENGLASNRHYLNQWGSSLLMHLYAIRSQWVTKSYYYLRNCAMVLLLWIHAYLNKTLNYHDFRLLYISFWRNYQKKNAIFFLYFPKAIRAKTKQDHMSKITRIQWCISVLVCVHGPLPGLSGIGIRDTRHAQKFTVGRVLTNGFGH